MALQNRITPFGELIAVEARGTLMGNRGGRLHDPATRTITRHHASRQWIACVLDFDNRRRTVMGTGYTELFFLDEVTALAAGHRPCFECRRKDAEAFFEIHRRVNALDNRLPAAALDRVLHGERMAGAKPQAVPATLPDGAMIAGDGEAFAVRKGHVLRWTPGGYDRAVPVDGMTRATVLTPPLIVSILAAGYRPRWHQSAAALIERGRQR